jgi:hypothetical protein
MAPGSQEASFLTVEEEAVPSTSVSKKSVSFILNRTGTPEEGSSSSNVDKVFWILGGEAKGTWAFPLRKE